MAFPNNNPIYFLHRLLAKVIISMKKLITLSLLLFTFFSAICSASNYQNAKITKILVGPRYGNTVFLSLNSPPNTSGCHTNQNYHYAFDGTTEQGKMYLSIALTAYTAQKSVFIAGYDNQCNNFKDVEDLYHLQVN